MAALNVRDVEDLGFQRWEWRVQRVGMAAMGLTLVAALTGLFGVGSLSETTAQARDDSVRVQYERFIRHVGTTTLTLSIGPEQVVDGKATLFISRDISSAWRIEDVSPAPSTESSTGKWLIYEFDVLGDTPPDVRVLYRGNGVGHHTGSVRAGSGDSVSFWQFIYP